MADLVSLNPARGFEEIGKVKISTKSEVSQKVKEARIAFENWGSLEISKRLKHLQKVYEAIEARQEEISKMATMEMGWCNSEQKIFDIGDSLHYFKWYLENAEKLLVPETTFEDDKEVNVVTHEPFGVAAVIQPWNFPLCQWTWAVVPNLVAGNTVVFKHSEEVPLTGKLIEEIVNSTDLPKGVFGKVYGDGKVGKMLVDDDIDLISFTGSYKVGQSLYERAADKFVRIVLELGGSAPGVVFEDADIDAAVDHIFALRYTNCGQACDGLKRLIVHESKFDEVVEKLKKIIESQVVGDPFEEKTTLGPLVAKRQQEKIASQLKDAISKGATVITGGKIPSNLDGAYFLPTLLTNITKDMKVWEEEVFGPVLPVVSFKTKEEALELANDTEYGLGGYVYSSNIEMAKEFAGKIKTGMVSINGVNYVCPHNPFGGYKHSGLGREHGKFGLLDVTQVKVVAYPK